MDFSAAKLQIFTTFVFNKVVQWDEWGEVENVWYKTLAILLSTYQKLVKSMDIWRSSDRNSLCSSFETRCSLVRKFEVGICLHAVSVC